MGLCSLKISTGPVNTLNYLHVTASKVSSPNTIEYEVWFKGPFSGKKFVIPNLDPEIYWIRYYFSVDAISLGVFDSEEYVNALSEKYKSEKRLYVVNGTGAYDPIDGASSITDPYLIDKDVTSVFKEAFRDLIVNREFTFDPATGTITKIDGVNFSFPETIVVTVNYNVVSTNNVVNGTGIGLYAGILSIPDATYTLLASDRNKMIRLIGSLATQFVTLPALSSVNIDDGFYFDNSVGGTAVQVKIFTQGGDRINYNGFFTTSNLFQEFWVSRGEKLLIRKMDNNVWEIRSDYVGVNVGSRMSGRYAFQAKYIPEDGRLLDGDEYGRLWFYITKILPNTHYITDDNVTNTNYTPPLSKTGMFTVHSSQKKFRMPLSIAMTERGLSNFNTYGTDTGRAYDYPGSFQDEMIAPHDHFMFTNPTNPDANNNPPYMTHYKNKGNFDSYALWSDNSKLPTVGKTSKGGGTEGRNKNIGVIYCTHI